MDIPKQQANADSISYDELNKLASDYYLATEKSEKMRIFEKAGIIFLKIQPQIVTSHRLKNLCISPLHRQLVEDACTQCFVECFKNYNPGCVEGKYVPFMAYYYQQAFYKSSNELTKHFGKWSDIEKNNIRYAALQSFLTPESLDEIYETLRDTVDSSTNLEESAGENNDREKQIAVFFGCILHFYAHRDMKKSTNQTMVCYFRTFYSGDVINLAKSDDEFSLFLKKYELLITKSYDEVFLDYVFKDITRSIEQIVNGKMKAYCELDADKFPESKKNKTIKIPIEQIIYSLFFNKTEVAISKQIQKYKAYKKELFG